MSSSSSLVQGRWIDRFLNSEQNSFLCSIDRSFIEDSFNLYGLRSEVRNYSRAIAIILDQLYEDADDTDPFDKGAVKLYGLIHARYILTSHGLEKMYQKYKCKEFGVCPRFMCKEVRVLPVGESDTFGSSAPKLFCPKCEEIFFCPRDSPFLDGAFFGRTFPHLFALMYKKKLDLVVDGLDEKLSTSEYEPRVFGFRIYDSARHIDKLHVVAQGSAIAGGSAVIKGGTAVALSSSGSNARKRSSKKNPRNTVTPQDYEEPSAKKRRYKL